MVEKRSVSRTSGDRCNQARPLVRTSSSLLAPCSLVVHAYTGALGLLFIDGRTAYRPSARQA